MDSWVLQEDVQDICNEHNEDHPEDQLFAWIVTPDQGSEFSVYGSAEAMAECEDTLSGIKSIRLIEEDAQIAVAMEQEQLAAQPPYEGEHRGQGRSVSRRQSPGQHGKGEVIPIEDTSRYAKQPGEPQLPFGYESPEPVTRMPKHRRPQPRQRRKKPPPPGMAPFRPGGGAS